MMKVHTKFQNIGTTITKAGKKLRKCLLSHKMKGVRYHSHMKEYDTKLSQHNKIITVVRKVN